MKLNKNTKRLVNVGDVLKFGENESYMVRTVYEYQRGGLSFTLEDVRTKQHIYLYPSSKCYGAEIIKAQD